MMAGRDWLTMTRADFDRDAPTVQCALLPAPDPAGTGDLFSLLPADGEVSATS